MKLLPVSKPLVTATPLALLVVTSLSSSSYAFAVPTLVPTSGNSRSNSAKGGAGARDLKTLSVTELKRLLNDRGVDFRDCLKKRDLVERLQEATSSDSYSGRPLEETDFMPSSLTPDENRLIGTFKRVSPAVAYITTLMNAPTRGGFSLQGTGTTTEVPIGTGSGFLWDHKGHVVTNYHVIAPPRGGKGNPSNKKVKVKLSGMSDSYDAVVVGTEPDKDLAVLKLQVPPGTRLPSPLDVGTSTDLQVGQSVLAIGNPFGLDNTLTTGVVSATGRDVAGYGGRNIRGCIQTDAAINVGNSGGPLLDSRGRLIGVNTAIYSPNGGMGGNVGIGFAIPVDIVRRVVNQIIRYGQVNRPSLGIHVLDDRIARSVLAQVGRKSYSRADLSGVLVAEVLPHSPLVGSSLQTTTLKTDGTVQLGDLIVQVNEQPVRNVEDLLAEIEEQTDNAQVTLKVLRRCNPLQVEFLTVQLTSSSTTNKQRIDRRRP